MSLKMIEISKIQYGQFILNPFGEYWLMEAERELIDEPDYEGHIEDTLLWGISDSIEESWIYFLDRSSYKLILILESNFENFNEFFEGIK